MRIGVIGAGIGGLTVAAGLSNDGHDVTVFEQRTDPAAAGAGLTLFGNSIDAFDAIGLGDRVRAVSSDAVAGMCSGQRLPSGRWLVSMPSAMVPVSAAFIVPPCTAPSLTHCPPAHSIWDRRPRCPPTVPRSPSTVIPNGSIWWSPPTASEASRAAYSASTAACTIAATPRGGCHRTPDVTRGRRDDGPRPGIRDRALPDNQKMLVRHRIHSRGRPRGRREDSGARPIRHLVSTDPRNASTTPGRIDSAARHLRPHQNAVDLRPKPDGPPRRRRTR